MSSRLRGGRLARKCLPDREFPELLVVAVDSVRVHSHSFFARMAGRCGAAALCVALGACSLASEALWPSLGNSGRPAATTTRIEIPATAAEQQGAAPATAAQATTQVGQRAVQLRDDAARLQGLISTHQQSLRQLRGEGADSAQRYQTLVGQINARLQVGTTPGNPLLTQQLGQAQTELDRFSANIGAMSQLATQVGSSASLGAFLLEALRGAYAISGALEEDHRQLSQTEDEVGRAMVTIDRIRVEVSEDIARHSSYVGRERANITTLAAAVRSGEFFGPGLVARSFGAAGGAATAQPAPPAAGTRPLVVIRFDRPNPQFEQALYAAANRALEVRPQVSFDVVGVAATGANQGGRAAMANAEARRQSEQVMRSLVEMGLPAQRVRLSVRGDTTLPANEVHVIAR